MGLGSVLCVNAISDEAQAGEANRIRWQSQNLSSALIDRTRPFIPEEFTPLFYRREYQELPDAARLHYNQLHALYFNEQVAFFEQEMLSPALSALSRGSLPAPLLEILQSFFAEEQRHTARFRELNLRCAPEFYSEEPYYFVRLARPLWTIVR